MCGLRLTVSSKHLMIEILPDPIYIHTYICTYTDIYVCIHPIVHDSQGIGISGHAGVLSSTADPGRSSVKLPASMMRSKSSPPPQSSMTRYIFLAGVGGAHGKGPSTTAMKNLDFDLSSIELSNDLSFFLRIYNYTSVVWNICSFVGFLDISGHSKRQKVGIGKWQQQCWFELPSWGLSDLCRVLEVLQRHRVRAYLDPQSMYKNCHLGSCERFWTFVLHTFWGSR